MSKLSEEQLLSALSDMEDIAKGGDSAMSGQGSKTPRTTAQANGGLSGEGDKSELSVSSNTAKSTDDDDMEKGKKGKQLSLKEWADEEETEHARKGGSDDDDDESSDYGDDDDDDEGEGMSKGRSCKKSGDLGDLLKSNSEVGPVLDAVPFIENVLDGVVDADTELRKSVDQLSDSIGSQRRVIKSMAQVVLGMKEQLDMLMDRPASSRKSVLSKSDVQERFDGDDPRMNTSPREFGDAICDLIEAGKLPPETISRYEMTKSLDQQHYRMVTDYLLRKSA